MRIDVDQEKCTGCGNCLEICPKGYKIWKKNSEGKAEIIDLFFCHGCTLCASKCSADAIKIVRDTYEKKEK
ncbi:MAG: ferredoxin family protein [Methanobacteriaceae archaeon]|nr:ferredoxin family protein [Methanobacteriaceae archaeon]MDZ4171800.1 ferredoxin family protein [Methanobacteriaceae archaeon]